MSRCRFLVATLCVLLCGGPAAGWWDAGHKIIASIAYRRLTAEQQQAVVALLRQHPRFAEDFERLRPPGLADEDEPEWIVQQASVWPDLARDFPGELKDQYHRGTWHYLNSPTFLTPDDEAAMRGSLTVNTAHDPPSGDDGAVRRMNIVQAIAHSRSIVGNPEAPAGERALHLSWLLHLIGDLHQPCHATALFSRRLYPNPGEGDRGGNLVFTKQRRNLHAVWDGFPGSRVDFRTARNTAIEWLATPEFAAVGEAAESNDSAADWLVESHALATEFVYAPEVLASLRQLESEAIDPESAPITLSEDYLKAGGRLSQRRVVEAGFRMGRELTRVR